MKLADRLDFAGIYLAALGVVFVFGAITAGADNLPSRTVANLFIYGSYFSYAALGCWIAESVVRRRIKRKEEVEHG